MKLGQKKSKKIFLMIRRPPRSTPRTSSAASDVYKRQAIALLLFGSKKIRTLGSDLGAGLKGFKKSMKDDSEDDQQNNN